MVGTRVDEATRARVGLPYFPGLDGLRAIAVGAVLLFHAGVDDAPGGFLGVSLFFTLSGFLITGLLVNEHAETGRIGLGQFWGRRVRRLLPAALACLGMVLAVSHWLVERTAIARLRIDIVAAAADVANWRFVFGHQSYVELFQQPSPVLHFWSLAIEEQFYLIFPVVVALLASRRQPWLLPLGLLALTGASIVASVLSTSHDLVYYGTHTRAAELLIGGLLAWFVRWRAEHSARRTEQVPAGWTRRGNDARVAQLVAFGALAALVVLVVRTQQSDAWLYRGGFAALAMVWCVLIVAARLPGPFRALVGCRALAAIGRRSYGLYLYHWPVFTLLTPNRLGAEGWQARAIQLALVAALTEVSYRVLERPIRLRRVLAEPRRARSFASGCIAAVIVAAVALPSPLASGSGAQIDMVDAPDEVVHLMPPGAIALDDANDRAAPVATLATAVPFGAVGNVPSGGSTTTSEQPPAVPALNVVVVGGAPEAAEHVRSFAADGVAIDVDDRTVHGCWMVPASPDEVDRTCLPPLAAAPVDVLVIGIGPHDHQMVDDALSRASAAPGTDVYAVVQDLQSRAVAEFERLGRVAGRVVVVDTTVSDSRDADLLDEAIDEAVLSTPTMSRSALADLQPEDIGASRTAGPVSRPVPEAASVAAPSPLKAIVIGDSTSYGVAQGLARSAIAPFNVVWAGKRNCPLARLESLRWVTGNEFAMNDCPGVASVWPEQIASFRPDVVVVVEGMPEHSEQRYAGDPNWYVAGDPQFVAVHDAEFQGLLDLAAGVGAVVILAAQPHTAADSPAMWATAERVDTWNAQIASWDQRWAAVATMPYGDAIESAEATVGHTLRPDGLHLDAGSVDSIVGTVLAPALAEQVITLQTELLAAGCIVDAAERRSLELSLCR